MVERRNRTLLEMVRAMMAQANLLISYWGDALLTAAYILNRMSSKSVSSTPYELWIGKKPDLNNLRPGGSTGYVHNTSHRYGKLGPRGKKCIFIRYSEHSKGYVLIGEQPDGSVTELESHDVDFIESEFSNIGEVEKNLTLYKMMDQEGGAPSRLVEDKEEIPETLRDNGSDSQPSGSTALEVDPQQPQPRRSNRGNIHRRHFEIKGEVFMIASQDDDEPKTVQKAFSSSVSDEWMKVMNDEMESMRTNQVWDLVDLSSGHKAIVNKWALKIKRKANGSIERYKARLVAKGYTQKKGVDYEETFSPVVRFASVRLILAIVANLNLELYQMDIKTTFLNGELDEEIYMDQPIGFVTKGQEHKMCKLKQSIYDLKQSSRQWYLRFHRAVLSNGFTMIEEDHRV